MELLVLDSSLISIAIIDTFESFIWTDRYCSYGDFEIYTSVSNEFISCLLPDNYICIRESEHTMIVEKILIKTDVENGNHLTITGRSLESILDRRIIWTQTTLSGNFQNGILKLLNENIILPTITSRRIDNFIFEPSTDPAITSLSIQAQFTGDNLYVVIEKLCKEKNIGFKITLNDNNQFVFKLYSGQDRSYDQLANPYVIFSPNFENITNSNYIASKKPYKTVSLVAGEGEGVDRKTTTAEIGTGAGSGLDRREMFTDARDLSQTIDNVLISDSAYLSQLEQRGNEDLSENTTIQSFDGQVDSSIMFKYGQDFFMGDIVQIENEYGIEAKSRVIEMIHSQSESGIEMYPTFSKVT